MIGQEQLLSMTFLDKTSVSPYLHTHEHEVWIMADQREYEITNLFLLWLSVWYFIYLTDIDRLLNPLSTRNSTLYPELISDFSIGMSNRYAMTFTV